MLEPAPSPARARLARVLLPALLHEIGNTTQRLVGVRALLELDESALHGGAGDDLAWASERALEQGWLMGVVAAALGVDVLLERRWDEGLPATLDLVRSGLAREGRACRVERSEVPRLARSADAPRDAALCLALALVAFEAADAGGAGELALVFERRGERIALCGASGADAAQSAFVEARELVGPAASLARHGDAWSVEIPAAWLRWRAD